MCPLLLLLLLPSPSHLPHLLSKSLSLFFLLASLPVFLPLASVSASIGQGETKHGRVHIFSVGRSVGSVRPFRYTRSLHTTLPYTIFVFHTSGHVPPPLFHLLFIHHPTPPHLTPLVLMLNPPLPPPPPAAAAQTPMGHHQGPSASAPNPTGRRAGGGGGRGSSRTGPAWRRATPPPWRGRGLLSIVVVVVVVGVGWV